MPDPTPAETEALQRALNQFTNHYLTGVDPLKVDGVHGSATRQRIKLCKFHQGEPKARRTPAVGDRFLKRLRRPKDPRLANPATIARGTRRRQRQRKNASQRPRIITAAQLGLTFQYIWGQKGVPYRGAGHYTAGHRSANATELAAEMRNDHAYHKGKGWGGLSYEAMVADDGTIGLGNPVNRVSAAVALNNSGMVGICCPGTTGDRMTPEQKRSADWLLNNWHTDAIPSPHRLPRPARDLDWRGHNEFPNQATACPGVMLADYKEVF